MKKTLFILIIVSFYSSVVFGKSDPILNASKLLKTHYYESATTTLLKSMNRLENNAKANMALGLSYHKNALLHHTIYEASLEVEKKYMANLIKKFKKYKSSYAYLFYAEALMESGDYLKASKYLKRFKSRRSVSKEYKAIANILDGMSKYMLGEKEQANTIWSKTKRRSALVKAELARVLFVSGRDKAKARKLMDAIVADLKQGKEKIHPRIVNSAMAIYADGNGFPIALNLLGQLDTSKPTHIENIKKQKTLRFYMVALSKNMAGIYRVASEYYLGKAMSDQKLKGVAEYYLAESVLFFAKDKIGLKHKDKLHTVSLPKTLRDKAQLQNLQYQYLKKRSKTILGKIKDLSVGKESDPDFLAQTILICSKLEISCKKAIDKARVLTGKISGAKARNLNYALGRHYIKNKSYDAALEYLETGRDKNMKNRIDTNDPLLLINLAEAYLNNKVYSENLEIYFELSKEFPVVRNIQNAVQGIYSMEYKSAGDVKIF